MRAFRFLLITALMCGSLLVVLAPGAGAASQNCAALNSLNEKLSNVDTTGKNFDTDALAEAGDEFHSAANKAKGKLKSALNKLGNIYDTLGSGDISDLQELGSKSYTSSFKVYTKALITCS